VARFQEEVRAFLDRQWHDKMTKRRDTEMGQALRDAAKSGDVQTIRALLDSGVPVDHCGEQGNTALHYAAREGRKDAVQALLLARAEVNRRNRDQRTPLHWAAANGGASVVRLLAQAGADLEARNLDGETPLEVANYWNNPETAPALRQLLGFNRRVGAKCEGFEQGVQRHFSVQRVGVFPNTKAWN
jgi:ankyrin repeat protein